MSTTPQMAAAFQAEHPEAFALVKAGKYTPGAGGDNPAQTIANQFVSAFGSVADYIRFGLRSAKPTTTKAAAPVAPAATSGNEYFNAPVKSARPASLSDAGRMTYSTGAPFGSGAGRELAHAGFQAQLDRVNGRAGNYQTHVISAVTTSMNFTARVRSASLADPKRGCYADGSRFGSGVGREKSIAGFQAQLDRLNGKRN